MTTPPQPANRETSRAQRNVAGSSERGVPQTLDVGRCLTEPANGEVEELLRAWRAGEKIPPPMPHKPVPEGALESVRRVAEFFLALRGLRHSELIDAPVMFAERWVAEQPEMEGLSHATAGRAIRKLRDYGFFLVAGVRPASEKHLKPVFLYELCPAAVAPGVLPASNVVDLAERRRARRAS